MSKQMITGKAFEYACLKAFQDKLLSEGRTLSISESPQLNTAKNAYDSLDNSAKNKYISAAKTAAELIFPLEPCIENGKGELVLSLNTDASGINGDVRDLLCIRISENWEIGISCKHKHEALKHPRITQSCNFGRDWLGYDCCDFFIKEMNKIIVSLDGTKMWRNIPHKHDTYYIPILEQFKDEIQRLCDAHSDAPAKLLGYFFGTNDFYKIISKEDVRQTKIMGFNLNGTMNKASSGIKPIYRVSKLHLPTKLYDIHIKENNKTTLLLTFDGGWSVKMRLHNKDKFATPTSLAWDVTLTGMPPELYQQQRSWDE